MHFGTYFNTEVTDATETISDARFSLAQPIVVRDANIVSASQELVLLCLQEILEAF